MNIAFFLTPKSDTVTLGNTMTIRQALEKLEYHKYSAVPVIDKNGRYVYSLSEGDMGEKRRYCADFKDYPR